MIFSPPSPTHDCASPRSAFGNAALRSLRPMCRVARFPDSGPQCVWGALRLASPSPREEALVPGSASAPSQPASRSPHSQSPAWWRTHTHSHTHTPKRGEFDLASLASGPERKIVWVNSQASRLNARLPPPPLHPLPASPIPLQPHPPPTLRSAARLGASSARLGGSPGLPGFKGPQPPGNALLAVPRGQKRTAGRWDRPGPR